MNERIEKLLEQAGAEWDDKYHWYVGSVVMKKFASLIVQECCDIFVELRTRPADLAVKDVKKHFGIPE